MTQETREAGHCSDCRAAVTLIHNSEHPTMRADGRRYISTDLPDRGGCLFRCRACHAVIDKNWAPAAALALH